jgi:hypothetical protein
MAGKLFIQKVEASSLRIHNWHVTHVHIPDSPTPIKCPELFPVIVSATAYQVRIKIDEEYIGD